MTKFYTGWTKWNTNGESKQVREHKPSFSTRLPLRHTLIRKRHRRHPRPLHHLPSRPRRRRRQQLLRQGQTRKAISVSPRVLTANELPQGGEEGGEDRKGGASAVADVRPGRVPRGQPGEENPGGEPDRVQGGARCDRGEFVGPEGPASAEGGVYE